MPFSSLIKQEQKKSSPCLPRSSPNNGECVTNISIDTEGTGAGNIVEREVAEWKTMNIKVTTAARSRPLTTPVSNDKIIKEIVQYSVHTRNSPFSNFHFQIEFNGPASNFLLQPSVIPETMQSISVIISRYRSQSVIKR